MLYVNIFFESTVHYTLATLFEISRRTSCLLDIILSFIIALFHRLHEQDRLVICVALRYRNFQVVLKGVAVLDDTDTVAKRKKIEEELAAKDAQFVVKKLVNDLMNGIRSPER